MSKAASTNLNLLDSEEYFWELVIKRGLATKGLPFGHAFGRTIGAPLVHSRMPVG